MSTFEIGYFGCCVQNIYLKPYEDKPGLRARHHGTPSSRKCKRKSRLKMLKRNNQTGWRKAMYEDGVTKIGM